MPTKAIILEIGSSCQSNEINMQKISFLRSISLYSWSGQKGMTYECIIADVDGNFPWMNRSKNMGTNCWSQTLKVSTIVTFMAYYLLKLPFILNVWISTIFGCSHFYADIAEKHIFRNLR